MKSIPNVLIVLLCVSILSMSILRGAYAVEEGVKIKVVSHNSFIDDNGFLNVVGLVKNTSGKAGISPFIKVLLYNKNGEAFYTFKNLPAIQFLNAEYVSPFKIVVSDARMTKETVDFKFAFDETQITQKLEPKSNDLSIENVKFFTDNYNITRISGLVRNNHVYDLGVGAENVATTQFTIGVAFIDGNNRVLDVKTAQYNRQTYTGESVTIDMTYDGRADNYCVVADSKHFVADPVGLCEPISEAIVSAPSSETITLSNFGIFDATKTRQREIYVGQQILLQSTASNNLSWDQTFAYIAQVKDSNGITVMLAWISGEISPKKSFDLALSWIPENAGKYNVEIFVWKDVANPEPLTLKPIKTMIEIQE
jgi:hypothetical protein